MKVLVDKDFLEDGLELICDSIRLKTGGTGVLAFPVEIKQAVDSIETGGGGITPTGTKTITENGEGIDVTTFAAVNVNVTGAAQQFDISLAEPAVGITVQNVVLGSGEVSGLMLYPVSGVVMDQEDGIYLCWSYPGIAAGMLGKKYYFGGQYRFGETAAGDTPIVYDAVNHTLTVHVGGYATKLYAGNYRLIVW